MKKMKQFTAPSTEPIKYVVVIDEGRERNYIKSVKQDGGTDDYFFTVTNDLAKARFFPRDQSELATKIERRFGLQAESGRVGICPYY